MRRVSGSAVALVLAVVLGACGSDGQSDSRPDVLPDVAEAPDIAVDAGAPAPDLVADVGDPAPDVPADVPPPAPLRIVPGFPSAASPGAAFAYDFAAEGGAPPYGDWRVTLGELPAGTTLDADTGQWAGAPEQEGVSHFVVTVADAAGGEASELFGLRVGDPAAEGPMRTRARDFQAVYEARHLWHGLSLNARTPDDPDGDLQLSTYGDCAFQSGQCTMAMAFRYAVEPTPEALDVVRQQVDGWRFFQRLTGVPGLIGRGFAHVDDPSQEGQWSLLYPEKDCHRGTGDFADWYWQADTSRDQVTGAVLGTAMAYDLVDDPHVRETAATFLTEIADHVWSNGLQIVDPDGEMTTHGNVDGMYLDGWPLPNGLNAVCALAWFKIAHHVSGEERFREIYEELVHERDYPELMSVNMWVYSGYQTRWFNTYMAFENFFHLMRLEEDPALRARYHEIFRDTLWLNLDDDTPNRRAIAEHNPVKTPWYLYTTGERDPNALFHALWQLVVFPEAPLRDRRVVNSEDPSIEKNPALPTEALYALPSYRLPPDMVIWHRGPYKLDGGADSGEERTGCDYLLPYWMGRYYGYIGSDW